MSDIDFIKDDFLIEMFKPIKEWIYLINLIELCQPFMIVKNEWLEERKDENVIFSGTKLDVSFATLSKLNLYHAHWIGIVDSAVVIEAKEKDDEEYE